MLVFFQWMLVFLLLGAWEMPAFAAPPEDAPPTLPRVIALARDRAPSVAAAREDVAIGRAEYVGARLPPVGNPFLEINADHGFAGATKDVSLLGTLMLPIEVSGQRGRRIAEVDALVTLREAELSSAKAAVAGEAVRVFGAAAVAASRVRTYERLLTVARTEAEIFEQRLTAGDATLRDGKLAALELARNSVALAEARADLTRALADMNRLCNAHFVEPPAAAEPPEPARWPAPAYVPQVRMLESEADYHARVGARQAREAHGPLNLLLHAGRGDLGEARVGGGIGFALPLVRAGQGEQARAAAARTRAKVLRDVTQRTVAAAIEGLTAENDLVRRAIEEIERTAEPAAQAAVSTAVATQRAGKGDLLPVLTARRDLALLEARRLDLTLRRWTILGDLVTLTGELP